MSFKADSYQIAARTLAGAFQKRGMEACYCSTKEEAKEKNPFTHSGRLLCHLGRFRIYGRNRCP